MVETLLQSDHLAFSDISRSTNFNVWHEKEHAPWNKQNYRRGKAVYYYNKSTERLASCGLGVAEISIKVYANTWFWTWGFFNNFYDIVSLLLLAFNWDKCMGVWEREREREREREINLITAELCNF